MPTINRFSTVQRGAVTFTGNTLGLAGNLSTVTPFPTSPPLANPLPQGPAAFGSIGTFISTNNALQAPGGWPVGTTNNYLQNSSSAQLTIPFGSTVLYAELIWTGTAITQDQDVSANLGDPINFTTPAGTTTVTPDLATASNIVVLGALNTQYVRSQDVTALVQAGGSGTYTVGAVPGALGNTVAAIPPFTPPNNVAPQNTLGWILEVVYQNNSLPVRSMAVWVNDTLVNATLPPVDVPVAPLSTPLTGTVNGKLFLASIEGDAALPGDAAFFGPNAGSLTQLGNPVTTPNPNPGTSPNNPINNFFASQINGDNGLLDTSGTFGTVNQNAFPGTDTVAARQGLDIAAVNVSNTLTNGQTSALIRMSTTQDAYENVAIGIQVDAYEPLFAPTKSASAGTANIGDTITYTVTFTNNSVIAADNLIFTDNPPTGSSFVAGTVIVDGLGQPLASPVTGIPIGTVLPGQTVIVSFDVIVTALPPTPPSPPQLVNTGTIDYTFEPIPGTVVTGTHTSTPVATTVLTPNVTINKVASKTFAALGDTITYTVTLNNQGTLPVSNVLFQDNVPAGTTYAGGLVVSTGFTGTDPMTGITITTINPGQPVTISWNVLIGNTLPVPNPIPNAGTMTVPFLPPVTTNTVTTQVNNVALDMLKSVDKTQAAVGEAVTYTITVTNNGNVVANPATFTDVVPNGTTYVGGTLTVDGIGNGGDPNAGFNIGPIGVGQTKTIVFSVIINSLPVPNPMPNTATVNYQYLIDPTGNPVSGSQTSNTVNTSVASVISNKTVDKTFANTGDTLIYTVTLTNMGITAVNNVLFQDALPAGTTYAGGLSVDAGFSGADPMSGLTITTINPSQVVTISWQVLIGNTLPTPNPIVNIGSVTLPGTTPIPTNSASTQVNKAILDVVKAVDKVIASVGETVQYTITVTNNGNVVANPAVLTDLVPSGTTYVPATLTVDGIGNGADPNTGINIGPIAVGQTKTIVFSVVINTLPVPNPMPNTAAVAYQYLVDPLGTPVSANQSSNTVNTSVGLIVSNKTVDKKFADLGSTITYTVTLTNTGIAPLSSILFQDTLPAGTTYADGLAVDAVFSGTDPMSGLTITTINPAQIVTISWQVLVDSTFPAPNPIVNIGNVTVPGTLTLPTNSVTTQVNSAVLDVVKAVDKIQADVGETLQYTIKVTNNGNVVANPALLTDLIPNGTSYVPATLTVDGLPNGANPGTGVNIGPIAVGQTKTIIFDVVINTLPVPNPVPNTATVDYQYLVDPNGTPVLATQTSNTVSTRVGNLTISKTVDRTAADLGDTLTYTLTIMNTGIAPINNAFIQDALPAGTTYAGGLTVDAGFSGTDPMTGLTITTINPGQTVTITWQVLVGGTLPVPNPIPNAGTMKVPGVPLITTNTVTTQINHADLVSPGNFVKAVDKAFADVGETVTYTVTVKNTGNTAANNVVVTDLVPNGTSYIPGTLTVDGGFNGSDPGTGIGILSIAAGQTVVIVFQVIVNQIPVPNPMLNTASVVYNYIVDPILPPVGASGNTNTVSTLVNHADLVSPGNFVKTVDKAFANLGDTVTYTVTMKNTGNTTANNVVVTDIVPNGTSYIGGTLTVDGIGSGSDPNTGIAIGSVAVNQTVVIIFSVKVDTLPVPNPMPNTADVVYNYIVNPLLPPVGASGSTNTVTTLVNHADLVSSGNFVKSVDKAFANLGDTVTYTVTVKNTGTTSANNVVVTDVVPNGTSYVGGTLTVDGIGNGADPNTGINIGSVAVNQTVTIIFSVKIDTLPVPNPMPNTAGVVYNYIVDPLLPPVGGSGNTNTVTTLVNHADLVSPGNFVKSVDKAFANLGDTVTYTVTVKNTGTTNANNVVVTDILPNGTSYIPGTLTVDGIGNGADPNTGINIGSIAPNQTVTIIFSVKVDTLPVPNPMPNTAGVVYNYIVDPLLPPVGASGNTNTVTTLVNHADLVSPGNFVKVVDKAFANLGDTVTYTVTVKNTGNTPANNVVVTDIVPNGTSYIPGTLTVDGIGNGSNPNTGIAIGSIVPNQTVTIIFSVKVDTLPVPNPMPNTAGVAYNYIVDPLLPPVEASGNTNTVTTLVNHADLVSPGNFVKTVDKAFADLGDTVTYTVKVKNTGTTSANNVVVTDLVPNGTSYIPGTLTVDGIGSGSNPNTGIAIGSIAPNQTVIIIFSVKVDTLPVPNPMPNTAGVVYDYIVDPLLPPVSASGSTNTVTTLVNHADLLSPGNFVKATNKNFADLGDIVTYTVTVKNTGTTSANNVVVTDLVPNGASYVPGTLTVDGIGSGSNPNTGILVGSIAPNQTVTIVFQVVINQIPVPNPMPNTAGVVYNYIVDPAQPPVDKSGNTNTVNTLVNHADLVSSGNFVKTVDKAFADVNEIITYTLTVKNTGNVAANNVNVVDPIPTGTTYVANTLTIDGIANGANPETGIPVGSIAAGGAKLIVFKVKVGSTVPVPNPVINQADISYNYIVNPALPPVNANGTSNSVSTLIQTADINKPGNTIKSADRTITVPGDTITYTVTVKNTGNVPANNVVVKDVVPVGTSFITGTVVIDGIDQPGENPVVGIQVGTVGAGVTKVISFKVLVGDNAPATIENQATTTYTYIVDPAKPPIIPPPAVTPPVNVVKLTPSMKIVKSSSVSGAVIGDVVKYTLVITNNGQVLLENVIITDPLTPAIAYAGNLMLNGVAIGGNITQGVNIGNLGIGQSVTLSFDAKVIAVPNNIAKTIINVAAADYGYRALSTDPLLEGKATSNPNSVRVYSPSIDVQKVASNISVIVGKPFVYTITVTNTGDIAINHIIVKDTLPPSFHIQSIILDGSIVSGDLSVGIDIGTLAIGEVKVMTVTVIIDETVDIESFKNIAQGEGTALIDPNRPLESVKDTGRDDQGINIYNPKLILQKSADKVYAVVGDTVTYTIKATNEGNVVLNNIQLDNVSIFDVLDAQLEFVIGSVTIDGLASPESNILAGVDLGILAVNQTKVITFKVKVLAAESTPITNIASGEFFYSVPGLPVQSGEGISNPYELNIRKAHLKVIKHAGQSEVSLGDTLSYEVEIINDGNLTAYNVLFTDQLPTQVSLVPGSFAINGKVVNGVNLAQGVSIPSIKPGEIVRITYQVIITGSNCSGILENSAQVTFDYRLPDGTSGTLTSSDEASSTQTLMTISTFKQMSIESYLMIPEAKPDIEAINVVTGTIDIKACHVIETPSLISREGQKLTGYKLVITGNLNLVIEYTALDTEQSVHSAHYVSTFSTFIILPPDYEVGSKLEVSGLVEDIYFKAIDIRNFFTNTTALINVNILNC